MIFDIIILIILVLTMVFGFRRGFVYSFMHTLGLIGSLVAAFLFRKPVQGLISDNTMLDENFYNTIFENVSTSLGPADTLPLILTDKINSAADDTAAMIAQNLTDFALQIISFFAIFIVVKLLCYIIISIFSRRNNEGFVGFFDGLLGLIAGFIKGILITFVSLALLAPGMNLMSPASAEIFMTALDNSYIAKTLYDANFLLLVLGF